MRNLLSWKELSCALLSVAWLSQSKAAALSETVPVSVITARGVCASHWRGTQYASETHMGIDLSNSLLWLLLPHCCCLWYLCLFYGMFLGFCLLFFCGRILQQFWFALCGESLEMLCLYFWAEYSPGLLCGCLWWQWQNFVSLLSHPVLLF